VLHDGLTGLPNRPLFLDRLRVALHRLPRHVDAAAAVMFLDLDGFKLANDTYGHDAGDAVLVEVGRRLVATLRGGDTVARFGGDEFLVLCEEVADGHEAAALAQRVADEVSLPVEVGDDRITVSVSIGVVVVTSDTHDPDDLVRAADEAMYRAKRASARHIEIVDLGEASLSGSARSHLRRPSIEAGVHPL
jgi:diguanylate cyclase (GGDEF)-like protein